MSSHSFEQAQEQAALYALGALNAIEHCDFEDHLSSGCDLCARELRAFLAVTAELGLATPLEATPASLRARVVERVAAEGSAPETIVLETQGLRFVRGASGAWETSGAPGCWFKLLHLDAEHQYRTQLIRMDPGAVYPAHRHADAEELYLLEGDLEVAGVAMKAGDYCRAEAGSAHVGARTESGASSSPCSQPATSGSVQTD